MEEARKNASSLPSPIISSGGPTVVTLKSFLRIRKPHFDDCRPIRLFSYLYVKTFDSLQALLCSFQYHSGKPHRAFVMHPMNFRGTRSESLTATYFEEVFLRRGTRSEGACRFSEGDARSSSAKDTTAGFREYPEKVFAVKHIRFPAYHTFPEFPWQPPNSTEADLQGCSQQVFERVARN